MLASTSTDWLILEQQLTPNIGGKNLGEVISLVLPYIFIVAGLIMLFYIILSGYQYMFSSGDPKAIDQAKKNITYAIVGFLVVFASYWAVALFGRVLGLTPITKLF